MLLAVVHLIKLIKGIVVHSVMKTTHSRVVSFFMTKGEYHVQTFIKKVNWVNSDLMLSTLKYIVNYSNDILNRPPLTL